MKRYATQSGYEPASVRRLPVSPTVLGIMRTLSAGVGYSALGARGTIRLDRYRCE
jgi:hypothetical protein